MKIKYTQVVFSTFCYFINFLLFYFLYSCSNEYVIDSKENGINFYVEDIFNTKGAGITNDGGSNPLTSMSVFCASTGQDKLSEATIFNWMYNAEVKRANKYSPWIITNPPLENTIAHTKWAGSGYHTFFAFAPYGVSGLTYLSNPNLSGIPSINYSIPDSYKDQVDVLYSHKTLINGIQMNLGNKSVDFEFRHALSKITLEARKDELTTEDIAITSVELTNIKNKGSLSYKLNSEYTELEGAEWILDDNKTNYQIITNVALDLNGMPLLPRNESFFLMPQYLDKEAKIIIIFDKGSEKNNKLEGYLSSVTPGGAWFLGKSYHYSILIKEGSVIINGEITDWKDQNLDLYVPGTYLNVSITNMTIAQGKFVDIYYSTDGNPINAVCNNNIILSHDENMRKFRFPNTAPVGNYTITITAGKLSRNICINVQ